ncbi:abortive infection family protein [Cupriavidus plantarum]|uniref:Abortive infection Abi-like protein n=1 Tax=Cupriavidus plantarum TaxID=942865 RepID=A0A316F168_9BURK|nr:abortive infection family protein [Cupriavidus plantarum]PWK38677.1 abortive infection Abi-like protein [Cupriavidus plantarum]
MKQREALLQEVELLQNILVSHATNGPPYEGDYSTLRTSLLARAEYANLVPRFVRTCRDLAQFWQFIKHKFPTYEKRRAYLWEEFRPLLERIEKGGTAPADQAVSEAIERFDAEHLHAAWAKALDRRQSDPDGAITIARTLLESTCKHILDELAIDYGDSPELPHLYRLTSKALNLAPSQHTEDVFKQILGGCHSVVEGLGALRNRLSDAHGRGKRSVRPAPRHAELAVNLSGALALYLLQTFDAH